ncbi:MAG: HD domain-containing protein [Erysipelotrichaceae bacterium]
MYPTKEKAIELIEIAEKNNPGAWVKHSYAVADCAMKIAKKCNMNADKSYVLGLLHDIGRYFGVKHFAHIYDGYIYMEELGYDDVARVCLSHSFSTQNVEDYIGNFDSSKEGIQFISDKLSNMNFDDYDKLIQLCDALAGTQVVDITTRMNDVKHRYGYYPQDKWEANLHLKKYFE